MTIWCKNRMRHFISVIQCGSLQSVFLLFCQTRGELRWMICLQRLHLESALIWVLWCWTQWGLLLKGFLSVGSVTPHALHWLHSHSPISTSIILKIELFMKPLHSNHFPVISEFSDTMIWCKNFSKQNTTGILCPVWILSNQAISISCYVSWDFFCLSSHIEKHMMKRTSSIWGFSMWVSSVSWAKTRLSYTKHIYSCSWKNYPLYKTNDFLHLPHVGFIAHVSPLKLHKKSWEEFPAIPPNNTIILY